MSHKPHCAPPPLRTRCGWVLLLVLYLPGAVVPAAALAAEGTAGREAMADAMSRMMESMGFTGPGAATPSAGALGQAGEAGKRLLEGFGHAVPGAALDGLWEAVGGGLLIVQGGHYRLYAPAGGYVDGVIQVTGQRVRLASAWARFAGEFEYALDQGRLALRDARGQVYLYRRLVLNGGS